MSVTTRINALSPALANQIAAGEVIERPAAALKELLENAIDAGADDITIDIREGGAALLRVQDNGDGIVAEDLPLALARHATSKIRQESDLADVGTFGFRGEALASLAAVADTVIASRTPTQQHGWEYGDRARSPKPAAIPVGTCVTARAMFANLPARRRFLRTPTTEAAHCTDTVVQAAVSAPAVAFFLRVNDRERLRLRPADSLSERLVALFPALADNLLTVDETAGNLSLNGCIFAPALGNSGKRIGQFLFVNGRYVRDRLLRRAVGDALREVAHDGEPGYALFLRAGDVDVNVHPMKLEVRFGEQRAVFNFVRRAVDKTLAAPLGAPIRNNDWMPDNSEPPPTTALQATEPMATVKRQLPPPLPIAPTTGEDWRKIFANTVGNPTTTAAESTATPTAPLQPLGRALGQIHDIYIVAENSEGLVIVDMHAAHERLIYEDLKRTADDGDQTMQPFLSPPLVPLTHLQTATLREHQNHLDGVKARLVDDHTAEISAVHTAVVNLVEPSQLLTDILDDMADDGAGAQSEEYRNRVLSSVACHAAVRANRRLTMEEMNALLRRMEHAEHSGACNHGRPCWQQIERRYFDRVFRRGK